MCLLIVGIAFPRLVLALLFFFTNFLSRAYHGMLIPLLGFFVLPLTTLVLRLDREQRRGGTGNLYGGHNNCVLVDLGLIGHTARSSRN